VSVHWDDSKKKSTLIKASADTNHTILYLPCSLSALRAAPLATSARLLTTSTASSYPRIASTSVLPSSAPRLEPVRSFATTSKNELAEPATMSEVANRGSNALSLQQPKNGAGELWLQDEQRMVQGRERCRVKQGQ
jgi:hypothetical protein